MEVGLLYHAASLVRLTCFSCVSSTDATGDGFAASGSGWDSLSIRHAFIRKVKYTCHGQGAGYRYTGVTEQSICFSER